MLLSLYVLCSVRFYRGTLVGFIQDLLPDRSDVGLQRDARSVRIRIIRMPVPGEISIFSKGISILNSSSSYLHHNLEISEEPTKWLEISKPDKE